MGKNFYQVGLTYKHDIPPIGSEIIVIHRSLRNDGTFDYSTRSGRYDDTTPRIVTVQGYTKPDEKNLLDGNNYVIAKTSRGVKDMHKTKDFAAGFKVYITRGGV